MKNQVKLVEASEKVFLHAKTCGQVYYELFNEHFRVLWNKKQDRYSETSSTELQIIDNMFGYTYFATQCSITDINVDNKPDVKQFFDSEERLHTSIKSTLYSGNIEKMIEQQRALKLHGMTDELTAGPKNRLAENKILLNELNSIVNGCDDDFTAIYRIASLYVDAYGKYVDSTVDLIDQQTKL